MKPKTEFISYYKNENDFRRLIFVYTLAIVLIVPFFYLMLLHKAELFPYRAIAVSVFVGFPVYMLLAYYFDWFRDKLIYLFMLHFYGSILYAYLALYQSHFSLIHLMAFYALFTFFMIALQRIIPAVLFICFVFLLLVYGIIYQVDIQTEPAIIFVFYGLFSALFIIVLFSRKKIIHNVEVYNEYLKLLVNSNDTGYALIEFTASGPKLIDYNTEAFRLYELSGSEDAVVLLSLFDEQEQHEIRSFHVNDEYKKIVKRQLGLREQFIEIKVRAIHLHSVSTQFLLFGLTDITARVQESKVLLKSEKKYRDLYDRNLSGLFSVDSDSVIVDCNHAFSEIFENEINKGDRLFNVTSSDWQFIERELQKNNEIRNFQLKLTVNNSEKWFIFNWYFDEEKNQIEGSVIDVTEVQNATVALIQNEEKYRSIFEESNDILILLDKDRIIDVNRKGISVFGMTRQLILLKDLFDLSYDTSADSFLKYSSYMEQLGLNKSIKFDWIFRGNNQMLESEVVLIELVLDQHIYYQCIIHDHSEQRRNLRRIERSRKSFQSVLNSAPEGIIIIKDLYHILYTNPQIHTLTNREEIDPSELFTGKDQLLFDQALRQFQYDKQSTVQLQLNLKQEDSAELVCDVVIVSTVFEDQEAVLLLIKDISVQQKLAQEVIRSQMAEQNNKLLATEIRERIRTEKLLQEQFLRTNAIFDSSSNTFLLILNLNKQISSFNTHGQHYANYLMHSQLIAGSTIDLVFHNMFSAAELRWFEIQLGKIKKGNSCQFEISYVQRDFVHWLELFINPIFDIEGKVAEISLVAHDVTDKKNSERELISSLREKEILLKEIHHRVKNNLQVISSILNLQSSVVEDPVLLEILEESRNRIRTMAIIHENLYQTTNFSSIDFSDYLSNLAKNLVSSYQVNHAIVSLELELDQVELILDQAIPCGLLVNELVTNSLKYAFTDRNSGKIAISLHEQNDFVILEIGDDGVGIDSSFDKEKSKTLGLQLVFTLVEQLEGEIKVNNLEGTKYFIKFGKAKL